MKTVKSIIALASVLLLLSCGTKTPEEELNSLDKMSRSRIMKALEKMPDAKIELLLNAGVEQKNIPMKAMTVLMFEMAFRAGTLNPSEFEFDKYANEMEIMLVAEIERMGTDEAATRLAVAEINILKKMYIEKWIQR